MIYQNNNAVDTKLQSSETSLQSTVCLQSACIVTSYITLGKTKEREKLSFKTRRPNAVFPTLSFFHYLELSHPPTTCPTIHSQTLNNVSCRLTFPVCKSNRNLQCTYRREAGCETGIDSPNVVHSMVQRVSLVKHCKITDVRTVPSWRRRDAECLFQ